MKIWDWHLVDLLGVLYYISYSELCHECVSCYLAFYHYNDGSLCCDKIKILDCLFILATFTFRRCTITILMMFN